MGVPVSYDVTYAGTGEQTALPLNRWNKANTSLVVDLATTGTYTIEATLSKINQDTGLTPIWFELSGLVGLTADITDTLKNVPLEAIRLNISANGTGIRFQILQGGDV